MSNLINSIRTFKIHDIINVILMRGMYDWKYRRIS